MTSLHDPLTLPCGQVLPNRIMKAALSEGLGDKQNSPDERLERLYTSWSEGGYGLIVTGNVMIDRTQLGEPGNVVIEDERDLDALSRWAKTTKDAGVPIWVQLNHPGRQSNPLALGHTPVAPSPVAINLPGATTPRELTSAEIEDIIEYARPRVSTACRYMVRTDTWSPSSSRPCRTSATTSGAVTRSVGCVSCSKSFAASVRGFRRASRWASSSTPRTSSAAGSPKMNPALW